MKKIVWTLFSFKGRLPRTNYFAGIVLVTLLYALYFYAPIHIEDSFLINLPIIPLIWSLLALSTKRLHDGGYSGWYNIIGCFFAPIWFLALALHIGQASDNKYGAPTEEI